MIEDPTMRRILRIATKALAIHCVSLAVAALCLVGLAALILLDGPEAVLASGACLILLVLLLTPAASWVDRDSERSDDE